jgi:hypothetical protein
MGAGSARNATPSADGTEKEPRLKEPSAERPTLPAFFTTIAMTDFKDLIQKMHGILVQAQGERDRGPTNTGRQAGG